MTKEEMRALNSAEIKDKVVREVGTTLTSIVQSLLSDVKHESLGLSDRTLQRVDFSKWIIVIFSGNLNQRVDSKLLSEIYLARQPEILLKQI